MPIPKRVLALFEKSSLVYEPLQHKVVYTAYDLAQTLKAPLARVAKPLILKTGHSFTLAVLSAAHAIDLARAARALKVAKVSLPSESVVLAALKLTKKNGIAPFGRLYNIPILLEKTFAVQKKGIFPTGSFTDSVRMKLSDFVKAEQPLIARFGLAKKMNRIPSKKKKVIKKKTTRRKK